MHPIDKLIEEHLATCPKKWHELPLPPDIAEEMAAKNGWEYQLHPDKGPCVAKKGEEKGEVPARPAFAFVVVEHGPEKIF